MIKLTDQKTINSYFENVPIRHFYHYFPLLYAFQETEQLDIEFDGNHIHTEEGFIYWDNIEKPIVPFTYSPFSTYSKGILDRNYIFDLNEVVQVKNFRANIKKFTKQNTATFSKPEDFKTDILPIIKKWYQRYGKECGDFGYTIWLLKNYSKFKDISTYIVKIEDTPVSVSLWGRFDGTTSIHIISKTTGLPYLQDYTRMMSYNEMKKQGYHTVNDGGDADRHQLRMYKLKLRPKHIIPIYTGGV